MLDRLTQLLSDEPAILKPVSKSEMNFLSRLQTGPQVTPESSQDIPSITGYSIIGELGRGGLGVVYLAWDEVLHRHVAIKQLHWEPSSKTKHRLVHEAQHAAELKHAGIVQIYSLLEHTDRLLLVMEFVDGGTLAQLIRTQLLEPDDAASKIRDLALALAYAHQSGVIHRDLKPSNILLSSGGQIKVADFGLAKRLEHDETPNSTTEVIGTPAYMAPEQAVGRAEEMGPACDIYALGCILYESLVGKPPFRAPRNLDTLLQVIQVDATPIRKLQPKVPRDLETICLKCLEKKPTSRYLSSQLLAEDLSLYLKRLPIKARRIGVVEKTRRWMMRNTGLFLVSAASILLSLILIVVTVSFLLKLTTAEAQLTFSEEMTSIKEYHRLEAKIQHRSQLRPVNWIDDNLHDIQSIMKLQYPAKDLPLLRSELVRCYGQTGFRQIRPVVSELGKIHCAAFSADGKLLALGQGNATDRTVCTIDVRDSQMLQRKQLFTFPAEPPRDLGAGKELWDGVRALAYSPDGKWLVAGTRGGRLVRWNLGNSPTEYSSWLGHENGVGQIKFSGDGKTLVSLSHQLSSASNLVLWDAKTWKVIRVISIPVPCSHFFLDDQSFQAICYGNNYIYRIQLLNGIVDEIHPGEYNRGTSLGRTLEEITQFERYYHSLAVECGLQSRFPFSSADQIVDNNRIVLVYKEGSASVQCLDISSASLLGTCSVETEIHTLVKNPANNQAVVLTGASPFLLDMKVSPLHSGVCGIGYKIRNSMVVKNTDNLFTISDGAEIQYHSSQKSYWKIPEKLTSILPHQGNPCFSITSTPDGTRLAYSDASGIILYDILQRKIVTTIPDYKVSVLETSADSVLWVSTTRKLKAYSVITGQAMGEWSAEIHPETSKNAQIQALAVGVHWVAAGDQEGAIRLFSSCRQPSLLKSWPSIKKSIQSLKLNSDETAIAIGTSSGQLNIHAMPHGEICTTASIHADMITELAWLSPSILVTGSRDRSLKFFSWRNNKVDELFTIHLPGALKKIHYLPNKKKLLIQVENETALQCWDLVELFQVLQKYKFASVETEEWLQLHTDNTVKQ